MFFVSILLILFSSYLLTGIVCKKKSKACGFLYLLLIAFSQVVLSFECLSLLKAISKNNFLICNIIFVVISSVLFIKTGMNFYKPDIEKRKIIFVLKRDKFLFVLAECFIIFLILQLITVMLFPVTFGDALAYYFPRCTEWIQEGSINHFITADTRKLIMPVNMEFLYTWKLLFTKTEAGMGVFPYIGFITLIYVLYNLLKELNFSVRHRLWVIFVVSSFPLVIVEMYTPCADLFIAALILAGIYLYLKSLKYDVKIPLYFSSLAFSLAIGTKTTAIIAIPSLLFILSGITLKYRSKNIKPYLVSYILFFIVNFIIFSLYNYVLNFIQYMNFFSSAEQLEIHKFRGGFKGYISNLIKYCFVIFDMSGVKDIVGYNKFITQCQEGFLKFLGIGINDYTSAYFRGNFFFNQTVGILDSLMGIIGLFVFLPSLIKSVIGIIKHKSVQKFFIGLFGISLIINILIFSGVMVFSGYNMRYIITFIIISIPICVYSYIPKKTLLKLIITILISLSMIITAHQKPMSLLFSYVTYHIKYPASEFKINSIDDEMNIYKFFKTKDKANIALILDSVRTPAFYIEQLRLHGFKIDEILLENIETYDLSKYDYIVINKSVVNSTYIVNFEKRINNPGNFVSKCKYLDYEKKEITQTEQNKPASVKCQIPYEYFTMQGFIPEKSFNDKSYWIIKK